ncbi:MAG: right-handed parallel beta-helix repeat-containing protein [Candidatus Gracilibacteria bacterium]
MLLKKITYIKIFIIIIFLFTTGVAKATDVGGTIATNTTWTTTGSPYIIKTNLILNSGCTLTIEPGVVVKVSNGLSITINGVLNAQGTLGNEIIFTSINDWSVGGAVGGTGTPARGNWVYLYINGVGTNGSILDYVEIKYGGSDTSYASLRLNTTTTQVKNTLIKESLYRGIRVDGNSTTYPTIQNSTITNYGYQGIRLINGNSIITNNHIIGSSTYDGIYIANGNPIITNNIIENNGLSGIYILAGYPSISGNTIQNNLQYGINSYNLQIRVLPNDSAIDNIFSGNTLGPVTSRGLDITSSGTVDGSVKDVIINGVGVLALGKTLTFAPGTVVKVVNGIFLQTNGIIKAEGTITKPIIFTSINDQSVGSENLGTGTPAKGNWAYFRFNGTGTNGSILDYTKIKYGGSDNLYGLLRLNITNTQVKNSLIEESLYRGISIDGNSTTYPTIQNSVIRNTGQYGIVSLSGNAVITGNTIEGTTTYDGIYIGDGSPTITNNIIQNNKRSGIYIYAGTPTLISGNTIQNNLQYGIDSYNLQVRVQPNDSAIDNIFSGNTLGPVTSRGLDITSSGTVDGSVKDVIINGVGVLALGKTLTFAPGTVVKVVNGIFLQTNGIIKAEGTITKPIIFTSINDQSVGSENLGTGTPAKGNWAYFRFNGTGTNGSILDYTKIKYGGSDNLYGLLRLNITTTQVKNSLIEESLYRGISIDGNSTTYPTIQNSVIRNNGYYGIISNSGNSVITNNNIIGSISYDGIYIGAGSPSIKNNIIKDNNRYGIYYAGTPTITYNLFHNNKISNIYNGTLDGTNIIGSDPLINSTTQELTIGSPAINTGDPSFGDHPLTGNRYDIGAFEYTGYAVLAFSANLTGIGGRSLTYEWNFIEDPTNGVDVPLIGNNSGTITVDSNISCNFQLKKLGNYKIKLVVKEGQTIIGEGTNAFTIISP